MKQQQKCLVCVSSNQQSSDMAESDQETVIYGWNVKVHTQTQEQTLRFIYKSTESWIQRDSLSHQHRHTHVEPLSLDKDRALVGGRRLSLVDHSWLCYQAEQCASVWLSSAVRTQLTKWCSMVRFERFEVCLGGRVRNRRGVTNKMNKLDLSSVDTLICVAGGDFGHVEINKLLKLLFSASSPLEQSLHLICFFHFCLMLFSFFHTHTHKKIYISAFFASFWYNKAILFFLRLAVSMLHDDTANRPPLLTKVSVRRILAHWYSSSDWSYLSSLTDPSDCLC